MNNVETWYYLQQGVSVGPMTRAAMEAMIRAGTLPPDTLVWPGYGDWIAASSSPLAPIYMGGAPMAPAGAMAQPGVTNKLNQWLPKDPNIRIAVMVVIVLIGLYAMYDGIKELTGGGGGGANKSINFQGCQGISQTTVQCGFTNTGDARARLCLDVVVLCADGRHVASTCSDRMKPGESSTKVVKNFKPDIQQNVMCSSMDYENLRS